MTIQEGIRSLGNRKGWIYSTDEDKGEITSVPNDLLGVIAMRQEAVSAVPFGNSIPSFASIKFGPTITGPGNITLIGHGGLNQIGANISFTDKTATQIAKDVEAGIVGYDPGTDDWDALAVGDTVYLIAPAADGDAHNGDTPVVSISAGTLDRTIENFSGGFTSGSHTTGRRFWIDPREEAVPDIILPEAVEITRLFVLKSANSGINIISATISGGTLNFERNSHIHHILVDGEGSVADDLTKINIAGIADGDVIFLSRKLGVSYSITAKHTAEGAAGFTAGSLQLADTSSFVMNDDNVIVALRFDGTNKVWREFSRPGITSVTDTVLKDGGAIFGKSGSRKIIIAAGGGCDKIVAYSDARNIILDGNGVTLTANYSLKFDIEIAPPDGSPFYVHYLPIADISTFSVTIFGIVLTEVQAESGAIIIGFYDAVAGIVRAKIIPDGATNFIEVGKIPINTITTNKLVLQTGLTAGAYTFCNVTVDAQGVITAIANGSGALAGITTLGMGGDLTNYEAVNDGNPAFYLGSAAAERVRMQAVYDAGTQALNYVLFETEAASAGVDKGEYQFNVDGTGIAQINDSGINVVAEKGYYVADVKVLGTQSAVEADPGAITNYTAHAAGAVAVTSNAATDLNTTAAALATLENEVTALRATVVSMLGKIRTHGIFAT